MPDTSLSLLDRLQDRSDAASWQQLVEIYSPLVRGWLVRYGEVGPDVDDLVQEVLTAVVARLPEFRRADRPGAFRAWLRSITAHLLYNFWRSQRLRPRATGGSDFQQMLAQCQDPDSALSRQWDEEHDRHVTQYLLERVRPDFEARTWRAFTAVALEGKPAAKVAAELNMTPNAVFIAKSRVLRRLRELAQGLLDD